MNIKKIKMRLFIGRSIITILSFLSAFTTFHLIYLFIDGLIGYYAGDYSFILSKVFAFMITVALSPFTARFWIGRVLTSNMLLVSDDELDSVIRDNGVSKELFNVYNTNGGLCFISKKLDFRELDEHFKTNNTNRMDNILSLVEMSDKLKVIESHGVLINDLISEDQMVLNFNGIDK